MIRRFYFPLLTSWVVAFISTPWEDSTTFWSVSVIKIHLISNPINAPNMPPRLWSVGFDVRRGPGLPSYSSAHSFLLGMSAGQCVCLLICQNLSSMFSGMSGKEQQGTGAPSLPGDLIAICVFRLWPHIWLILVPDIPGGRWTKVSFFHLTGYFKFLGILWPAVLNDSLTWECNSGLVF